MKLFRRARKTAGEGRDGDAPDAGSVSDQAGPDSPDADQRACVEAASETRVERATEIDQETLPERGFAASIQSEQENEVSGAELHPERNSEVNPELNSELPQAEPVKPEHHQSAPQQSEPRQLEEPKSEGFYARLKRGLSRTGNQLASGLGDLFLGRKTIDEDLLEDLESQLLLSDIGIEATQRVLEDITARVSRKELADGEAVMKATQSALLDIIRPCEQALDTSGASPYVILVVGVNGAGKTTTIGKLAHRFTSEGKKVMLAAGDTFRAAAVEQLQTWGERHDVPVIAQHTGADSASVLFDGLQAAKSRGADILIADTAGRLQNKAHLMDELEKVVRVMKKLDPSAPHETLLVLDAGTGQNAVAQAEQFDRTVGVTGIVLTKLDGTARGGVIFAIAQKLSRPIRFIGIGESATDLRPFAAEPFVEALFDRTRD